MQVINSHSVFSKVKIIFKHRFYVIVLVEEQVQLAIKGVPSVPIGIPTHCLYTLLKST